MNHTTHTPNTTRNTAFARFLKRAFLAFIFISFTSAFVFSIFSWQREKNEQLTQLSTLTGFLSTASQAFFENISNSLPLISQLITELDVISHPENTRAILLEYQSHHPEIGSMSIISPDGTMLLNTADISDSPLPDYRDSPESLDNFRFALNDAYPVTVGRTEYDTVLKTWCFPFRHTVRSKNGKPLFMLQASVPLQDNGIIFLLGLQPLPDSVIGLVRSDGFQQAQWPISNSNNIYKQPVSDPMTNGIKANPGMLSGSFFENTSWFFNPHDRFGVYQRLPNYDLFAYISVPSQRIWQGWLDTNAPLLFSFLAFMAIFGAISYRVSRFEQMHSKELLGQARRDPLTGLPNRAAMEEILSAEITLAEEASASFAVIFLDLDHFKFVNDTLGHAIGDKLLIHVTQTVRKTLRRGSILCRLGGDEFLIIIPDCNSDISAMIVERIVNEFQTPTQLDGHELRVTSSIGIAIYPENGTDMETLLKHADAAMYAAKHDGRNSYAFYEERLGNSVRQRIHMEHQLRAALDNNLFELHYQPVINLRSGKIIGVEALLRMRNEHGDLLYPADFITTAECSGLILLIGEWVLNTACRQARQWASTGHEINMAVNLSTRQFQDPLLAEKIERILVTTQMSPDQLEIEITESAAMHDPDESIRILNIMKAIGISIAIDDFGTGYSSLSYLKRIPADKIKIDKTFVEGIGRSPDDTAIVRAILALASSMDKNIQAEGIENREQYETLRIMGCESAQGYWMCKPLPADEINMLLLQNPNFNTA